MAPAAATKGLELAYEVDDDLPPRSSATSARSARSCSTCCRTRSSSPSAARSSSGRRPPARAGADGPTTLGDRRRRPRHRHRHPGRADGPPVPVVQPGGRVDLAALRRHRPRPGDQPAPGRGDGRQRSTAESTGVAGEGSTFHLRSVLPKAAPAPVRRRSRSDGRSSSPGGVSWSSTTTRRTGGSWPPSSRAGGWTPRDGSPSEALGWVEARRAVRRRPARPAHAGAGRARPGRGDPDDAGAGEPPARDRPVVGRPAGRGRRRRRRVPDQAGQAVRAARRARRPSSPARRAAGHGRRPPERPSRGSATSDERHPLRILLAEDNAGEPEARPPPARADGLRADVAGNGLRGHRGARARRHTTWC